MSNLSSDSVATVEVGALSDLPHAGDAWWAERLVSSELAHCLGFARAGEHLAARLLAKRAVARALGWTAATPWHHIVIVRGAAAAPVAALSGDVEAWRRSRRLPVPGVSLTHAGGYAAALAWLPCGDSP